MMKGMVKKFGQSQNQSKHQNYVPTKGLATKLFGPKSQLENKIVVRLDKHFIINRNCLPLNNDYVIGGFLKQAMALFFLAPLKFLGFLSMHRS